MAETKEYIAERLNEIRANGDVMAAAARVNELLPSARADVVSMLRSRAARDRALIECGRLPDEERAHVEAYESIAGLVDALIRTLPTALNLARLRDAAIREAMARSGGHPHPAAKLLGVTPATLYRHLRRLGIISSGQTSETARAAGKRSAQKRAEVLRG